MRRGAGTWPGPDHVARGRWIPVGTAGSRPYTQPATKRRTGAAPTHTTCRTSSRAGRPATTEAPAFVTPHPTRGVGCNRRNAPPFCVGARAGTIMFRPAILRNCGFRGQRGAAAASEHQASGRSCQSEPNLMGTGCSLRPVSDPPRLARLQRRPAVPDRRRQWGRPIAAKHGESADALRGAGARRGLGGLGRLIGLGPSAPLPPAPQAPFHAARRRAVPEGGRGIAPQPASGGAIRSVPAVLPRPLHGRAPHPYGRARCHPHRGQAEPSGPELRRTRHKARRRIRLASALTRCQGRLGGTRQHNRQTGGGMDGPRRAPQTILYSK